MWKRIIHIGVCVLVFMLNGCNNAPNYQPENAAPCDPNYAHCPDESLHEVAQQINTAM